MSEDYGIGMVGLGVMDATDEEPVGVLTRFMSGIK